MSTYSPFDKSIAELEPADLEALKNVNEGWYVEYKSELVRASALAKTLAAFANTYGGWLFLGVKEKSKDDCVAGEFPGLTNEDVDRALQRLRHSASDCLNPVPYFETKILRGPCDAIGLAKDVSVIAVEVPQSLTTPHIHRDGRIYRRVGDGSEPKPETDRFILDQLWRRDKPIRKAIRKWINRDPEFSKGEAEFPYIRILLCVDPWCQRDPYLEAPLPEIKNLLTGSQNGLLSIRFDTVYTTVDRGIIARQILGNDPHGYVFTWKMQRDLSCDLVIPIPFCFPDSLDQLEAWLEGYNHQDIFINVLREANYTHPRVTDLNFLMYALIAIVAKCRKLLALVDRSGEFFFKARILNAWRILPFMDLERVLRDFDEHGLPMVMNESTTAPFGEDPESFEHITEKKPDKKGMNDEAVICGAQAFSIFVPIGQVFGIPTLFDIETEPDELFIPFEELCAAGERAMEVQKRRNNNQN